LAGAVSVGELPPASASATSFLTPDGTSSPVLAMPYHATTMTPMTPVMILKTRATMPRGVKLRRGTRLAKPFSRIESVGL